jgi:Sulfatase
MNRRQLFLSSAKGALLGALGAIGFRTQAQAQSPTATQFPDSTVLPTPTPPFKGFIQPNLVDSQPGWPPTIMPPEGAPNVLLILIDDAGFGSNSAFGGVVPTPTLDKLAQRGLRYTQMHNTALCSPTRAALLTGRNHHRAGFGTVAEAASGYPG